MNKEHLIEQCKKHQIPIEGNIYKLTPELIKAMKNKVLDKNEEINNEILEIWKLLPQIVLNNGSPEHAYLLYRELYDFLLSHQIKTKSYVSKAFELHQLGWVASIQNKRSEHLRYTLLAFIEDIIAGNKTGMAYPVLRDTFAIPDTEFKKLEKYTKRFKSSIGKDKSDLHGEFILLDYEHKTKNFLSRFLIPMNHNMSHLFFSKLLNDANKCKTKDKGMLFERAINYLFSTLEDLRMQSNIKSSDEEHDIVLHNLNRTHPLFSKFGDYILIECKHRDKKIGSNTIREIASKMEMHECKTGILITSTNISGHHSKTKGHSAAYETRLKYFHRRNKIILVVSGDDLKGIENGSFSLIEILLREYEQILFDL